MGKYDARRGGASARFSRPVGCLLLALFVLLEMIVGCAVGYVFYRLIFQLFLWFGWTGDWDFAQVSAISLAIIPAAPFMWWVDGWGKRLTGKSAMETVTLPF